MGIFFILIRFYKRFVIMPFVWVFCGGAVQDSALLGYGAVLIVLQETSPKLIIRPYHITLKHHVGQFCSVAVFISYEMFKTA
jgi:hypothetical protein